MHRRASTLLKETIKGFNLENGDESNNTVYFDDRQTIASSGIHSSDPSVVQEEKLRKTQQKLIKQIKSKELLQKWVKKMKEKSDEN
jgi:hypothetical protein